MLWRRERSLALAGNRTPVLGPPARSVIAISTMYSSFREFIVPLKMQRMCSPAPSLPLNEASATSDFLQSDNLNAWIMFPDILYLA
jgi:hypothetical protein